MQTLMSRTYITKPKRKSHRQPFLHTNDVRPVKPSCFALKYLVMHFCTSNLTPDPRRCLGLINFFEVEKLGDEAKVEDDSNKNTTVFSCSPLED